MIHKIIINYYRIIIPVTVMFIGVFFRDRLEYLYNNNNNLKHLKKPSDGVFTNEILAKYNGVTNKKLYVAVLGVIFDVSKSPQHYAKEATYHYFVGKDGSRALVTGDFKDESANRDHVLDLPCVDIITLEKWKDSLQKKYKMIGILSGRYYNENGKGTGYLMEFKKKLDKCLLEKEAGKQMDTKYPPCNIAWSEQDGTKVWCTKSSGGIHRHWVGVPRQLFIPGHEKPKCICVNTENKQDITEGLLKEYSDCSNTSSVCYVVV